MDFVLFQKRSLQISNTAKEWIIFVIALACIFLFLISAYDKIVDNARFAKGLSRVAFIGGMVPVIAWLVPVAEIVIVVLLIIPATRKLGLQAFTGLMGIFTLYILSMLLWSEKVPCHCNLIVEKLSFGEHVWFNLGFMALSISALWLKKKITDHSYQRKWKRQQKKKSSQSLKLHCWH